jgi:hypothetical protein
LDSGFAVRQSRPPADEELSFKAPPNIQAVGLKKKPLEREAHLAVIANASLKRKAGNTMEIKGIS